jgi:hypothetical protein
VPIITAVIELDQLRCNKESDGNGHSEPYIWPALLQVDDDTLSTPVLVSIGSAPSAPFRVVVQKDMQAGQSAPIPAGQNMNRLVARFRDGLIRTNLILVVALSESDGTPEHAIDAGFVAFREELRDAIAANLSALDAAKDDPDQLKAIIDPIKKQVGDKVDSAIDNELSAFEKAEIFAGVLGEDDKVGSDFILFETMTDQPFTLHFASDDGKNEYELDGRLTAIVNPCQAELDRINIALHTIENIKGALKQLHNQPEGPANEKKIEQLEAELLAENAELKAAQQAFQACSDHMQDLTGGATGGLLQGSFGAAPPSA